MASVQVVDEDEQLKMMDLTRRTMSFAQRASAPDVLNPTIQELRERLSQVKEENLAEEFTRQQSMKKLHLVRGDLQSTLDACHKTLEVSGKCLTNYFKTIPTKRLSREIGERFSHFDRNGNGVLDREEVREGMAEMGQRPSDDELETFFVACDIDGNGSIDRAEFEAMIRVKLGLEKIEHIVKVAKLVREVDAGSKKGAWAMPLARRGSCPEVIFSRKQLPQLKPVAPRGRRASLTVADRVSFGKPNTAVLSQLAGAAPVPLAPQALPQRRSVGDLQRRASLEALHRKPSGEIAERGSSRRRVDAPGSTEARVDKAPADARGIKRRADTPAFRADVQG